MNPTRPLFGSHSDTSTINLKHMVTDLFGQMREPSSAGVSPGGSTGSLANVTKNMGFLQQNTAEHLPWSNQTPAIAGHCNYSNLGCESQPALVRSVSNASALTSLCADLSLSDSHFFEVLYIGKVRISQRKVPESLIDDALTKFAQHDAEKALRRRHSLLSSTGTSLYSNDSTDNLTEEKKSNSTEIRRIISPSTTPLEPIKGNSWKSVETLAENTKQVDEDFDLFTKERAEKVKKPTQENNVSLSVPKNNLGTVREDEEKIEVGSVISDASSTQSRRDQSELDAKSDVGCRDSKSSEPFVDPLLNRKDMSINFKELQRMEFDKKIVENKPFLRDRSASIGTISNKTPIAHLIGEQNRTMLFQVGRSELRLISPDRKQILLHRAFKDVVSCVLGRHNKDHFGFVCRETNDSYACYVFKCESDGVAGEVVNAIRQAFVAHADILKKTREKSPNMTCEHCPMLWYHRLCHDIDGMNDKKAHAFILRRIEQLPDDEQDLIITKYQGGTNHIYETGEHNSFLMMLLRAHCEAKQQRHVHDTAENRSEFLNQYLGGSTIFMKAKRSLSSGFDHLLKRKAVKDEINTSVYVKKDSSPVPASLAETSSEPSGAEVLSPDNGRSKSQPPVIVSQDIESSTPKARTSPVEERSEMDETESTPTNSPMMDIYLKVSDSRSATTEGGNGPDSTWRQAIYEKVVQPTDVQDGELPTNLLGKLATHKGRRSKAELRQLWKMAIDQTILLVRMEKENAKLRESEESSAVRRIKLEYTELGVCDAGVTLMWDSLLSRDSSQPVAQVDRHMLTQAVIQGVPRSCRGAVWYFLAEQAASRAPPLDPRICPAYHTPYATLLAGLTKHQHAILIDLGRTFPKHSYFASALGPGQLALYNILKAYSLLDPDVGYCQGLSFVAGVLLLHMEEADAFILLRHLMFRRGLRRQYLPDMSALQVQLYQLSRLLRDHEPELHAKLEALDISPALYAAPWMLTLFTSQFPLGLVVRVFDLIFLESLDVVFSVSLALLSVHKDGLMMCESCEEAAEYLKHKLPDMNRQMYEKVMKKVITLDISRQLSDYAVEYGVLKEEMPRLASLTEQNRKLTAENNKMSEELDSAMEAITNYQKSHARLEAINKNVEQQLSLLSRYINSHHKTEMPPEVKKIVQNHGKRLSFSSKIFSTKFSNDDEEAKKHKHGVSSPNLFSKMSKEEVLQIKQSSPEFDRRFVMKKSQSVHSGLVPKNYPLKVLDEREENKRNENEILSDSLKELGLGQKRVAQEQILQKRYFEQKLKNDFDENLKRLDEKLTPNSYMDDLDIFQSKKSMSLNLKPKIEKVEEAKLDDSGFVTPLSPEYDKRDDCSIISHPLSDCDVDIKFDGQSTKLKQIRPIKHAEKQT